MNAVEFRAELQRLVDGELEHVRRVRLLQHASRNSDQWRPLALAFIEKQIVDESLAKPSVVDQPSEWSTDEGSQLGERRPHLRQTNGKGFNESRIRPSTLVWSTVVAACLLIGFAIGNWRGQAGRIEPGNFVATRDVAPRSESVEEPSQNSGEPTGIPLADALSRASYPIPVDLRREMMKQGYLITELDRLSKVKLPTGQTVEMPVRQVAVTYLGTAAYQ